MVSEQVLLGALAETFGGCLQLAAEHGLGLEIQAFAFPRVLNGDWQGLLKQYQRAGLCHLNGPLAMHGAFMELAPGSCDPLIREATRQRVLQSLEIAAALGASTLVFHTNYIATIQSTAYRYAWTQNNIDFWAPIARRAGESGITIALENMWECTPVLLWDILHGVESPHLRACLDVGHAHLFSAEPLSAWLEVLGPYLTHAHLNNNSGDTDQHQALDHGVLDYTAVLAALRALSPQPTMTLEMNRVADMRRSLPFFRLAGAQHAVRVPA